MDFSWSNLASLLSMFFVCFCRKYNLLPFLMLCSFSLLLPLFLISFCFIWMVGMQIKLGSEVTYTPCSFSLYYGHSRFFVSKNNKQARGLLAHTVPACSTVKWGSWLHITAASHRSINNARSKIQHQQSRWCLTHIQHKTSSHTQTPTVPQLGSENNCKHKLYIFIKYRVKSTSLICDLFLVSQASVYSA